MCRRWLNIIMLMAGCLPFCFTLSCINEEHLDRDYEEDSLYTVALNISTISTRDGTLEPAEKIKSFRVIITSAPTQEEESESNGTPGNGEIVQLNKFVTQENLASNFNYYLLWHTNKGTKNVYLFANEESVKDLSYSNGFTGETDLSTLLNSFTAGTDASDLKSILTSAYFTPDYESYTSSGSIYLPYTSIYEEIEVSNNTESYEMHLVPVATKFIFNFINHRPSEVYVNGISINSTNTDNYLFAKVGDANMQMTLPEETSSLYWVEWLAKVSELSQDNYGYGPNQSFNSLYGWIWDYNTPTTEVNNPYEFIASDTTLQIDGISYPENEDDIDDDEEEMEGIPGKCTVGPFYVPESKVNVYEPDTSNDNKQFQKYYLTIGFSDSDPENKDVPDFSEVEIDNLNALFRNTSVIINLVMRQGDVEIYAKIAPWTEQQAYGSVTEGNKPDFLNNSEGLRLLRNVVK